MKKHLFITVLCACTFLSLSFYSCSQDSIPSNQGPATAKSYTVHLGFGGEITDISTSPLTKAAASDSNLYGIQVYSCPVKNSVAATYTPYAYGLFDNTGNMTVNLKAGYIYKFACAMVVNGENKIWHDSMGREGAPYYNSRLESTSPNNEFAYTTSTCFVELGNGYTRLISDNYYNRPNTDRYYGELTDFTPAENKTATISMKKACFGAKFIAEGLTEGHLKISMTYAPDMYIAYPDTIAQDIFTFNNVSAAWAQDNYSEIIPVSISWTEADGTVVPLATQNITFKRNMLTTIIVKVNATIKNGIGINSESTSMGDGGSVTIYGGSNDNTKVNP